MFIIHKCYGCKSTDISWGVKDFKLVAIVQMKCNNCGIEDSKTIKKVNV